MIEMAEVFHRYGSQYREKFGQRMLSSHRRAMAAIEQCRTEALGGHVYYCEACDEALYSYHSCKNRHCPKCQNDTAQQWLLRQQELLLPTPYFMVTFTLPAELKQLARSNQKTAYNILFRTSAAALQQLARDPRFVGGQIGMVGVLQILRSRSGQALDPGSQLSSPRPLSGARRGSGSRWSALAARQKEFPGACQAALHPVSGQVPRRIEKNTPI
jgi:hypothetical protein